MPADRDAKKFLDIVDEAIGEAEDARRERVRELAGATLQKKFDGLREFGCRLSPAELRDIFAKEAALKPPSNTAAQPRRRTAGAAVAAALAAGVLLGWGAAPSQTEGWGTRAEMEFYRAMARMNAAAMPEGCIGSGRIRIERKGAPSDTACVFWVPDGDLRKWSDEE